MKKMKLMLVDDEERYLETTKKLITRKGFDVLTAQSGAAALELLEKNDVHVVILDVKMPGMDGNETLRHIKQLHPMVEVIMLTGHATVDSAVDGLQSGACDYLMKPADIDEVIEKAKLAFARREMVEEKIRHAQTKKFMRTPREILKDDDDDTL